MNNDFSSLRDQHLWAELARIAADKQDAVTRRLREEAKARKEQLIAEAARRAADNDPERWDGLA